MGFLIGRKNVVTDDREGSWVSRQMKTTVGSPWATKHIASSWRKSVALPVRLSKPSIHRYYRIHIDFQRKHRSLLRRPFPALHQPIGAKRDTRAKRSLPPQSRLRRKDRCPGNVRALSGLGRRQHEDNSQEGRRRLHSQRHQNVDHQRPYPVTNPPHTY